MTAIDLRHGPMKPHSYHSETNRGGEMTDKPKDYYDEQEEIAYLRAQLQEHKDYYAKVINEPCPSDEIHCACVPALRARIADMENALQEIAQRLPTGQNAAETLERARDIARRELEKKP